MLQDVIQKTNEDIDINNLIKECKMAKFIRPSKHVQEENKITENTSAENYDYNISVNSQNNDKINEDLSKALEEAFNKYIKNTEQLNNTENHLTEINTLENNKSNNLGTSALEANNEREIGQWLHDLSNDLFNATNSMDQIPPISTEQNDFNSAIPKPINKKENYRRKKLKRSWDDLHNVESETETNPLFFLNNRANSPFNEDLLLQYPYSSFPSDASDSPSNEHSI